MKFLENEFSGALQIIKDYLVTYSSKDQEFKKKLENSEQTSTDLNAYIRGEARAKAINGVACIPDEEVFGWAIHFIDENIQLKAKAKAEPKRENIDTSNIEVVKVDPIKKPKKAKVQEKKKSNPVVVHQGNIEQLSIFDLLE